MRTLLPVLVALMVSVVTPAPGLAEEAPQPMSPALATAAAESDTYPQDYAAAVRYAQAAVTAERPELALIAWDRAMALSGGNLEVLLGRSLTLLDLGRIADARRDARSATDQAPDQPIVWTRRAWAQRNTPKLASGAWGQLGAESSYRRALALDSENAAAHCGLAWSLLALGDRLGAERAFRLRFEQDPADDCAIDGAVASAPRIAGGGGVVLAGIVRDGHPLYVGGLSLLVQGGVEVADLAFFQVTGRFLWLFSEEESGSDRAAGRGGPTVGPASGQTATYDQQELWLRAGAHHRGAGGQVLVGVLDASTSDESFATVGGQGWVSFGATLRGEGAWAGYGDGETAMGGLGLRVPVTSFLSLDGGLRLSSWMPTDSESEGPYAAGSLAALLDVGRLHLEAGGRFGTEIRPLRFDEPILWNTTERYVGGAFVDGTVELHDKFGLSFGYELLRMQPVDGSDDRHTHVFSLGVYGQGVGGLRR